MRVLLDNCNIFDSESASLRRGRMLIGDERILSVFDKDKEAPSSDITLDLGGRDVFPGLVDIHTHGRATHDFCFASAKQMMEMAHSYAKRGTTSLFPTLASAPFDELLAQARLVSALKGKTGGAEFLGVHLEGRYLNAKKRGAHNTELLAAPNANEIESFLGECGLPCRVSAALELDTDGSFADVCKRHGARLSLGHTNATYGEAMRIYNAHNVSFTHLYNAMTPLHHRDGGVVLAAFNSGGYCEVICDGEHICPEMIDFTLKNIGRDRLALITDSMAAAGAPDGEYVIAGNPAVVKDSIARTPDGALAGSTLSLDDAVRNLACFTSLTVREALLCATIVPARAAGVDNEVGELREGKRADFLIGRLGDKELSIDDVYVGGKKID